MAFDPRLGVALLWRFIAREARAVSSAGTAVVDAGGSIRRPLACRVGQARGMRTGCAGLRIDAAGGTALANSFTSNKFLQ